MVDSRDRAVVQELGRASSADLKELALGVADPAQGFDSTSVLHHAISELDNPTEVVAALIGAGIDPTEIGEYSNRRENAFDVAGRVDRTFLVDTLLETQSGRLWSPGGWRLPESLVTLILEGVWPVRKDRRPLVGLLPELGKVRPHLLRPPFVPVRDDDLGRAMGPMLPLLEAIDVERCVEIAHLASVAMHRSSSDWVTPLHRCSA